MSDHLWNLLANFLTTISFRNLFSLLTVAGTLLFASAGSAQSGVNLTGKWEGNGGSITTFEHKGNVLIGKSWGGPNNTTLTGSMKLTLSANRPLMFKGTYEGTKGNATGNGTILITVHSNNKLFVSYKGIVTDGKRTDPVSDSGFASRK